MFATVNTIIKTILFDIFYLGAIIGDFTIEKILKRIYYYPCKSYTEVLAKINLLHEFLEKHKNVSYYYYFYYLKLNVIDVKVILPVYMWHINVHKVIKYIKSR